MQLEGRPFNKTLGIMRAIVAGLMAMCFTSACVVEKQHYYLPLDPRLAQEGNVCGFVPYGIIRVPVGDNLSASVSIRPREGKLGVSVQLALPPGAKVRLLSPALVVEVPSTGQAYIGLLDPFQVGVYGRGGKLGHQEKVSAESVLEGKGRNLSLASADTAYLRDDLYISNALIDVSPAEDVILLFPAVETNGRVIDAQRIQLQRKDRIGVMTCVQ